MPTFAGFDIHHAFSGFGISAAHLTTQTQGVPESMHGNESHGSMNTSSQFPVPSYSHAAIAEYNSLIERLSSSSLDSPGFCTHDECAKCPTCSGTGRVPPEVARDLWHRGQPPPQQALSRQHQDLVRAVAMDADVVVSASYDSTIKVWDRNSGTLLADLVGGHTGRIFGVAFDCTKIVSCGEDEHICIWDLSYGLDISFVQT